MIAEEDDEFEMVEFTRICAIISNQVCRIEWGAITNIATAELLDPEQVQYMTFGYVYGILNCVEDICKLTLSRACQIH